MLAEAGRMLSVRRFDALYLLRPLLLPDGHARLVQLILRPSASGFDVELASAADESMHDGADAWTTHLLGRACAHDGSSPASARWDLAAMQDASTRVVSGEDFYARIWANQGGTGSSFRWIDRIWQGERRALLSGRRTAGRHRCVGVRAASGTDRSGMPGAALLRRHRNDDDGGGRRHVRAVLRGRLRPVARAAVACGGMVSLPSCASWPRARWSAT
jgi:hypothetical protein